MGLQSKMKRSGQPPASGVHGKPAGQAGLGIIVEACTGRLSESANGGALPWCSTCLTTEIKGSDVIRVLYCDALTYRGVRAISEGLGKLS